MIEVKSLCKTFGEVKALDDVSFEVVPGQITGFLGSNGAGKTTTMDILCGCLGPDSGVAKICGFDIATQPLQAKKSLGYLPDEPPLYNEMRVDDYIRFAADINKVPRPELKKRVDEVIDMVSIGDVRKRLIGNLSKGYRQRVALAQALVHNPKVLILDEPTEGLDPNQIIQIRKLIRQLAGEHTILLSSHILSEVENTCDQIIIINQGKVLHQGTRDQVLKSRDSGKNYKMRLGQNYKDFVDTLKSIDGVHDAAVNGGEFIEFSVLQEDPTLDRVVQAAISQGHGIRELLPVGQSLEQIFQDLTKS